MINCPICSVVNDDSARFCAECGQRLQPDPAPAAAETLKEPEIVAPVHQPEPTPAPIQPIASAPLPSIEELKKSAIPPKPVKKLHSPLLKPDPDYDDEEPAAMPPSKKGRSLRSPILGGSEPSYEFEAEDEYASKHKGLRSPLLGGGEVEQSHRFVEEHHSRPGHLHSPLLDSTYDEYDDFIDDFETVEDPNVLRSPLLAAKVPMHSHSHEPAQPTPEPQAPPPVNLAPPAAQSPTISPAQPVTPPTTPPATPPVSILGGSSTAAPVPPAGSTPFSDVKPAPMPLPEPSRFPTAGIGQLPHPTKVGMSSPSGLKSSLLGSQEDDEYESSRYAPPPEHQHDSGMSSVIRMFVWPLGLAAVARLWVLAEYARGGQLYPAVIAGELSHLVVIAFLILVAINYPGSKSSS